MTSSQVAKIFIPRGEFQTAGVEFAIDHPRGQINVDMGLGKTNMLLSAIAYNMMVCEDAPTLVIAPLRVARNTWSDEAAKWTHTDHLRVSPIIGSASEREAAIKAKADIYTINYENLVWLCDYWGDKWPYRSVVADESTKLKSHRSHFRKTKSGESLVCTGGSRAAALAKVAFRKVRRWHNLTGTPTPNGLQELWGQYWFIDGGERLGRAYSSFERRWFQTDFNGFSLKAHDHAEGEIMAAIRDVTFTLRASDYLELGKEIVNTIFVDLPPKAMAQYKQMEKELYVELKDNDIEVFTAVAKSNKCHQMANGAVYYDKEGGYEKVHDAKLDALQSVVEEANGVPVIVVYTFKADLERLLKAFPKGKKFDQNPETEKAFKRGEIPILFLHPDSAGHGVDGFQNVTNIICFFSVYWSGETRAQTIARIGAVRQLQAGFDRPVFIHQIIARGTIDEDILDRIESKRTVEESLKRGLARRCK